MILQGPFKLTEAKCICDESKYFRNEDRLHPSCGSCGGNPNEMIRHRCLVPRIYLGGHDDPLEFIPLNGSDDERSGEQVVSWIIS